MKERASDRRIGMCVCELVRKPLQGFTPAVKSGMSQKGGESGLGKRETLTFTP